MCGEWYWLHVMGCEVCGMGCDMSGIGCEVSN